jgi:hypothetical protein
MPTASAVNLKKVLPGKVISRKRPNILHASILDQP